MCLHIYFDLKLFYHDLVSGDNSCLTSGDQGIGLAFLDGLAKNRTVYHVGPSANGQRWLVTQEGGPFREEHRTREEAVSAWSMTPLNPVQRGYPSTTASCSIPIYRALEKLLVLDGALAP